MQIRDETAQDTGAIAALITEAFRTAPHASGTEAQITAALRGAGALMLSLVAEDGGRVLGHVAASPARVGGAGEWALIGPLAVLPEAQHRGIGSALMQAALARLRPEVRGVALVGDPDFYTRFGLRAFPHLTAPGVPAQYVLALPFNTAPPQGALSWHRAFDAP